MSYGNHIWDVWNLLTKQKDKQQKFIEKAETTGSWSIPKATDIRDVRL